ncbi:MAG: SDR family NAD(P)-dependent oxidoreductase, partial [Cryomorphaceae bacterium]
MANKVVLVTGGSSGIGLATCKYLQSRNCKVYGTSRKVSQNGEIVDGIPMLQLDLNQLPSIHTAVNFILEKEGRLDVLVNNAGVGIAGALEDTSTEEIETAFRTNVFGVFECCRAVIPQMRKQGGGWIVNISSIAGEFGLPFRGIYCATK